MAKTNFLVKAKNLLSNLWKKWCKLELGLRIFFVVAVILWFPFESFLDKTFGAQFFPVRSDRRIAKSFNLTLS